MKKYKVIIDTDPGVDDATALVFALNEPQLDIKLFTISGGNIHLSKASRNMCHLLDVFDVDIPVVNGYSERLGSSNEFAYFLHGEEGLGNYIPPKTTKHKPLNEDCADAMYKIIKENPHEITMIILGPHTNFAYLLAKHPDAARLIKQVLMMGASLDGIKTNPNHKSFNIRTDAFAFKQTVNSKLPVLMCPSKFGRDYAYWTEEQVNELKNSNMIGKFLAKTYETYWEPNYPEKIIANCDLSAIYFLLYPKYYKAKKAFVDVDTEVNIGATVGHYDKKGYFNIVQDINRPKFMKMIMKKLHQFDGKEFSNPTFKKNLKEKSE